MKHVSISLTAILILSAVAFGGKGYLLSKRPVFHAGDVAVVESFDRSVMEGVTPDSKTVQSKTDVKKLRAVCEVLKTDADGTILEFRTKITSLLRKITAASSGRKPIIRKMELADIYVTFRRKEGKYRADTTSVRAAGGLTASQVYTLKDFLDNYESFPTYPEKDAPLLPTGPIAVGQTWKPTQAKMDAWGKLNPSVKEMNGQAAAAEFRLESVENDLATIAGKLELTATLGDQNVKMTPDLSAKIDLGSGHWKRRAMKLRFSVKTPEITMTFDFQKKLEAVFRKGKGKVSVLPEKLHDIGWKSPGEDRNSYKDPANGFSLDIPKGSQAGPVQPNNPTVAKFRTPDGVSVAVTRVKLPVPMDVEDFIPSILKGMKKNMPTYALSKRTSLSLSGNVPAMLLDALSKKAAVRMFTVLAVAGENLLSVTSGSPAGNDKLVEQARKIALTLRVFKPVRKALPAGEK